VLFFSCSFICTTACFSVIVGEYLDDLLFRVLSVSTLYLLMSEVKRVRVDDGCKEDIIFVSVLGLVKVAGLGTAALMLYFTKSVMVTSTTLNIMDIQHKV